MTIVLTTHDMDGGHPADRVGIMDHGKLLALDSPEALTRGLPGRTTLEVTVTLDGTPAEELLAALGALDGVERAERVAAARRAGRPAHRVPATADGAGGPREPRARLYVAGDALMVAPVAAAVSRRKAELTEVSIGTPSLEDVFIHLTVGGAAMSATVELPTTAEPVAASKAKVFGAVLRRDLYVTWRELPVFLAQVVLQPLFLLRVRPGAGRSRLHPARLHRGAVPRHRGHDRRAHRAPATPSCW